MPRQANTDQEIVRCFAVMLELRPHLKKESFLPLVRHMYDEGFRLAYLEKADEIVAVAGYRIYTNLVMGKNLYVDDLVTAQAHRSKGYGEEMLLWLKSVARGNGCRYLHLDSGVQRYGAHKFYFRQGLFITSYHFAEEMPAP